MIRPAPHIAAMAPYALANLDGQAISLAQNESLRAPSPIVAEAVGRALANAQLYPDPNWTELRDAIARLHGIPAESILCSNGSMELILAIALAYADDRNAVLAPAHAYPFFRTAAQLARARFDTAPEKDGRVDVDALLAATRPDTRLVFVANPGNPTGTRLAKSELGRLRDGLPEHVLLVIDEAYGEFADHLNEPVFDLVARGDTVVLRTLSKAFGLAGMRVGWGLFPPDVAREVRKVKNPNNVSVAGQAAALAAITDQAYMQDTCALTMDLRDGFIGRLQAAGFAMAPSFTNFALVRFASPEAAISANTALLNQGIVARGQAGAGLPDCLRITVGSVAHMQLAADVLISWRREQMR